MREDPNRIGSLKAGKELVELEPGKTISPKARIDFDVKLGGCRKPVELIKSRYPKLNIVCNGCL